MGQTALGAGLLRLGYLRRAGRRLQVDPRPRGRRRSQNRYQPGRGREAHLPRLLDRRPPQREGRVRGGRVPPPERRAPEQAPAPRLQGRAHEAPGALAAPPRPPEGDERERLTDGRAPHDRERGELRGSARGRQLPRGGVPEEHSLGREDADDPRRVHPPAEGPAADPAGPGARAPHLRRFAEDLAKTFKGPKYFEIQERLAEEIEKQKPKMSAAAAEKVNVVNVDYYAATTYTFLGIPADLGTSIFAVGRMAGWCAHVIEQHAHNRLIRPESEYTGPTGKKWIPLAER